MTEQGQIGVNDGKGLVTQRGQTLRMNALINAVVLSFSLRKRHDELRCIQKHYFKMNWISSILHQKR